MFDRLLRASFALAMCATVLTASADELAEKGRAILEKNKSCVVTVRIVIKIQMSMQNFPSREDESKTEATGTVIDPSGLTVLSLNETDPSGMLEDMMGGREGLDVKSSIGDMKILQNDGTEIPAQVVLRDRDLDLAFIRPTEPPKEPMPAIDFTKSVAPNLLDPIITITRLGRVAGREYAVSIERISAIVNRPRTFYIMGKDPTQTGLGNPALSVDGDVIGLCVMRSIKRSADSGMGMFGGGDDSTMAIVVPASDILDVAKQAPAAGEEAKELGEESKKEKAEEPKAEDGKPAEPKPNDGKPAEPAPKEPAPKGPDGTVTPSAPAA